MKLFQLKLALEKGEGDGSFDNHHINVQLKILK